MGSPRFAWGIDVGNRALKAIRLVRDGEELRIDDFEIIEHEQILSQAGDNRDSLLQASLANFAQKHNSKKGAVAIGVTGQASFARFIKLPPVEPSKIVDIVKFEAVQQIPFPLTDVEWSYQLFQTPESPEIEVGIFAMRRELVNQIIRNFTDVGIEVSVVQMNPLAVYNGLYYDNRIDGTTMIIDVGAENSDLIIAEAESIWMRSIPIGGNNFTDALVKSFKQKFAKSEELKRNAATSKYGRQILQAMKPVFSELVGEIQRSIGFYSSTHRDSRINKVLALGGTFRLPGLQKYLQQNLQLDVVRIDRLNAPTPADARFATAFNENLLSSIGAYGLALQAMGAGKIQSSLLPEKIRRERMWREKTPWFGIAAAMFLAGTGIAVGKLYADRYAYDNQAEARKNIEMTTAKATTLDGDWKKIESSGNEDRTKITDSMSLLNSRDLSILLGQKLMEAFPQAAAAELQKPRREDRQVVELVTCNMRYEPDITGYLPPTMSDDAFNGVGDKIDLVANSNGTGSYSAVAERVGSAVSGPKGGTPQRGFIVTIICRTPVQNPTQLIATRVQQKLLENKVKPGERKLFSIERVAIPSNIRVREVFPNGTLKEKKPPLAFAPPGPGGQSNPGAPPPPAPIDPNSDKIDHYPDLMHKGESIGNDTLVTVVAAVLVDPAFIPRAQAQNPPAKNVHK